MLIFLVSLRMKRMGKKKWILAQELKEQELTSMIVKTPEMYL